MKHHDKANKDQQKTKQTNVSATRTEAEGDKPAKEPQQTIHQRKKKKPSSAEAENEAPDEEEPNDRQEPKLKFTCTTKS